MVLFQRSYFMLFAAAILLSGCACPKSFSIDPVKLKDKELTCKDIVLEINEAEFHRKKSEGNKDSNLETYLNPFCYPTTFLSADKAARAAQARLEYLNELYDLKGCDIEMRKIRAEQRKEAERAEAADVLIAPLPNRGAETALPNTPTPAAPAVPSTTMPNAPLSAPLAAPLTGPTPLPPSPAMVAPSNSMPMVQQPMMQPTPMIQQPVTPMMQQPPVAPMMQIAPTRPTIMPADPPGFKTPPPPAQAYPSQPYFQQQQPMQQNPYSNSYPEQLRIPYQQQQFEAIPSTPHRNVYDQPNDPQPGYVPPYYFQQR